jgi:hypothetical protein
MSAPTTTAAARAARHPVAGSPRVASIRLTAIALLAFLAGLEVAGAAQSATQISSPSSVPATFDAARFRADERTSWAVDPTFDVVAFRADERAGR